MLPGKKYTVEDVLPILRRRIWLLAVPPAVGLFAALIVSAQLPNLYQSQMLISIIPQRVPDAYVRSTVTLRAEERLDAITTQVKSRTLIEQLIRELDLYTEERDRRPMEDVVQLMRDNIDVQPQAPRRGARGPEPLHAFHVRFNYTDPRMATVVTERLGSLFVNQNAHDRGVLAEETHKFLEAQLAEARQRLEKMESRLEAFRQRHGNELPTQMQSNLQVMQNTQMQIQGVVESMARDRDRKLMLERLYNEAQAELVVPPSPPPQAPTSSDAAAGSSGTPDQQLAAMRATLARLQLRLRPEHPDVVRAKRLIQELETRVQSSASASETSSQPPAVVTYEEQQRRERLRGMRVEIESLDRQTQFKESELQRLRGLVAEYQRRVEAVPGLESEWIALTRDYETQQNAYKDLLAKSEQSKVAVDLERRQIGEQFRVLDPAAVPVRPISPNRIRINGIGFAVGLSLGLVIAALLEFKDASFRTERDLAEALSLPVLALVPYVVTTAERTRRSRLRFAVTGAASLALVGAGYVAWTLRLWNFVL